MKFCTTPEQWIAAYGTVDITEFEKLRQMCEDAGIEYTVTQYLNGYQIRTEFDDAIIHFGSHGVEFGLLESYKINDCEGYQTAEDIFAYWKEWAK